MYLLNLKFKSLFLALTIAAAFLIIAIEWMTNGLTKKSPILKYLLDLSVEAPNTYHQVLLFSQYYRILFCISYLILWYNTLFIIKQL